MFLISSGFLHSIQLLIGGSQWALSHDSCLKSFSIRLCGYWCSKKRPVINSVFWAVGVQASSETYCTLKPFLNYLSREDDGWQWKILQHCMCVTASQNIFHLLLLSLHFFVCIPAHSPCSHLLLSHLFTSFLYCDTSPSSLAAPVLILFIPIVSLCVSLEEEMMVLVISLWKVWEALTQVKERWCVPDNRPKIMKRCRVRALGTSVALWTNWNWWRWVAWRGQAKGIKRKTITASPCPWTEMSLHTRSRALFHLSFAK